MSTSPVAAQENRSVSTPQDHLSTCLPQDESSELVIEILTAPAKSPAMFSLCYTPHASS